MIISEKLMNLIHAVTDRQLINTEKKEKKATLGSNDKVIAKSVIMSRYLEIFEKGYFKLDSDCLNKLTSDFVHDSPITPYGTISTLKHVKRIHLDYKELSKTAGIAVEFLDACLDIANMSTLAQSKVLQYRKIGIGVSDFDLLCTSQKQLQDETISIIQERMASKVGLAISQGAYNRSEELAFDKGVFENWSEFEFVLKNKEFTSWKYTNKKRKVEILNGREAKELIESGEVILSELKQVKRRNSHILIFPASNIWAKYSDRVDETNKSKPFNNNQAQPTNNHFEKLNEKLIDGKEISLQTVDETIKKEGAENTEKHGHLRTQVDNLILNPFLASDSIHAKKNNQNIINKYLIGDAYNLIGRDNVKRKYNIVSYTLVSEETKKYFKYNLVYLPLNISVVMSEEDMYKQLNPDIKEIGIKLNTQVLVFLCDKSETRLLLSSIINRPNIIPSYPVYSDKTIEDTVLINFEKEFKYIPTILDEIGTVKMGETLYIGYWVECDSLIESEQIWEKISNIERKSVLSSLISKFNRRREVINKYELIIDKIENQKQQLQKEVHNLSVSGKNTQIKAKSGPTLWSRLVGSIGSLAKKNKINSYEDNSLAKFALTLNQEIPDEMFGSVHIQYQYNNKGLSKIKVFPQVIDIESRVYLDLYLDLINISLNLGYPKDKLIISLEKYNSFAKQVVQGKKTEDKKPSSSNLTLIRLNHLLQKSLVFAPHSHYTLEGIDLKS